MSLVLAQTASGAAPNETYLMWGFILAAGALGLLLIELLIPSGGLLGLLCGIAAIGSIISFFQYDTTFGVAALLAYIILTPILLVFFFKLWIQSPLARRMVLGGDVQGQADGEQDTLKTAETPAHRGRGRHRDRPAAGGGRQDRRAADRCPGRVRHRRGRDAGRGDRRIRQPDQGSAPDDVEESGR
jgi:membrane protein implicated in regulation of membrane protease activity